MPVPWIRSRIGVDVESVRIFLKKKHVFVESLDICLVNSGMAVMTFWRVLAGYIRS